MLKKVLALFTAAVIIFSCMVYSSSAESDVLRFNSDGKFKIVVFADCQDDESPYQEMIDFMGFALDNEKPDLVVFTGDNVVVKTNSNFSTGAAKLIQPLIERNVPYAYTYGNHDAQYNVSKEYQYSVYKTLGRCLTYNADDSIYGYGNCNLPIYSSSGNDMAFNLWIIDSNMYDSSGYDYVHTDQLNWIKATDAAIEAEQGHKVNSLVFQHIVVPEVYNCLTESSSGSKTYNGKKYELSLNSNAHGYLGEFPCPPTTNNGEFSVLKEMGDVIGIVTGHDHSNSFIGTWEGLDFIQMPGMTFESYGDSNCRGYGVIELDENDTSSYTSYTLKYTEKFTAQIKNYSEINNDLYFYQKGTQYISDIKCANNSNESSAKSTLTNEGYTVIDFDLNKGAKGDYIFMGYKTTDNYSDAIKDIRFYSEESDFTADEFVLKINGRDCVYHRDSADLNKKSGGDYIYACYTKDPNAGYAITGISFNTAATGSGKVAGKLCEPETVAELNNGTSTHNNSIYCLLNTNTSVISNPNYDAVSALYYQLAAIENVERFTAESRAEFIGHMSTAETYIREIEQYRATSLSEYDIDDLEFKLRNSAFTLTKGIIEENLIYGITSPVLSENFDDYFNKDYLTVDVSAKGKYVGTGSVVRLSHGETAEELTALIYGDINGDGWYDGQDAVVASCISAGILTKNMVGHVNYTAADCNHDGVVNSSDILLLEQAGLLLSQINQKKDIEDLMTSAAFCEYIELIDQCPQTHTDEIEDDPVSEETNDDIDPEFSYGIIKRIMIFISELINFLKSILTF